MAEARGDDPSLDAGIGSHSGRSIGVRLVSDELHGADIGFVGRAWRRNLFGVVALVSFAGAFCALAVSGSGPVVDWLLVAAMLILVGILFVWRAAHSRPDRIVLFPDRMLVRRGGRETELFYDEIMHVDHVLRSERGGLALVRAHLGGSRLGESSLILGTAVQYGDLQPLVDALWTRCEVQLTNL